MTAQGKNALENALALGRFSTPPRLPKTTWVEDVRRVIKREHGKGWRIEEQSGRIKLTYVPPGGQTGAPAGRKQAVTTHLEWAPSSQTKLVALLAEIRNRMETLHFSLGEAYAVLNDGTSSNGNQNWSEVARRYEEWRLAPGIPKKSTYDREERHMIEKTVAILKTTRNAPTTGKSLVERYASKHLKGLTPGGGGRSKHLATVVRFLEYSVKRCGANPCWSPPDSEDIASLRGYKEEITKRTIPVKPEQLLALLESLENKPDVRLAVALVGLYGLRPSELRTLQVVDGELRAASTKRNMAEARRTKPPRLLQPLDLKELPGEGERVLRMYESGLVKLPCQIINAKDNKLAGHAFGQYLRRNAVWRSLVAANAGLTPYGLRHGYAWRGAKYYDLPIPLRDLADLMGHTLPTHLQYYGQWTSDQDKKASVQRAVKGLSNGV